MLEDKLVHTLAQKHHDDHEMTGEDYDDLKHQQEMEEELYEDDEMEEEAEDVPEMELLAMMDAEEDSLHVVRRLFYSGADLVSIETKLLGRNALASLREQGFVWLDGLFDGDVIQAAREAALQLAESGEMIPAGMVRLEDDPFRDRKARDDVICWLHKDQHPATHPALDAVLDKLQLIQRDIASVIRLKGQAEYQLAVYKGNGGHYERHRDAFPIDDDADEEQRRVTVVVYLTDELETNVGGGLKIFRPLGHEQIVESAAGRVMIFLSGVVDHEVLPVFNMRAAVSAWIR
ncbi:hypothetical protein BC830DRAFT_1171710 [Chytriomyces sp. MP71]|nr:hypothetical protein BC830DRAFT_1171710 [Chytriomyces sp. MP71]